MLRRLLALAFCVGFALPVQAQSVVRLTPQPAPLFPVYSHAIGPVQSVLPGWYAVPDSLPAREVARRIARIYNWQAKLLEAEVRGQNGRRAEFLDKSMRELRRLMTYENVRSNPRFREVYRTVVAEHQAINGVEDTLALGRGDIFTLHDEMFAALDADTPLLENTVLPELGPQITEVPLTMNERVARSLRYFARNPRHVTTLRQRAGTYFPMMEQILAEEGVPDELKYLAIVESGLVPVARSWASAAGLWQFIGATGRHYGLDVTRYVDERLDPEKATRAAARHLRDLHEMFDGDWHLALAGYNCNPYRVRREAQRFEKRTGRKATFWDIYPRLPRETRNYVPMYIAAALVISNPEAFDLPAAEFGPEYTYDLVPVRGRFALRDAAEMAGVSEDLVRALNPELTRGMTPPSSAAYPLRLPAGTHERFLARYGALPTTATVHTYRVRKSETIADVARKHAVSESALRAANDFSAFQAVEPGDTVMLPTNDFSNPAAPAPMHVRYQRANVRPLVVPDQPKPTLASIEKTIAPVETKPQPRAKPTTHRVRRGETLGHIARRYGVSVRNLQRWNGLSNSFIRVGQRLAVDASVAKHNAALASAEAQPGRYRVRSGDSLYVIARRHGVTVNQLKKWNALASNKIKPGQVLKVQG